MKNKFDLISFDLDNALYDNRPVLKLAELSLQEYLAHQFNSQNKKFNFSYFINIKKKLLATKKPAFEDLSFFRRTALQQFCAELKNSEKVVNEALEVFIQSRSKVEIPEAIQVLISKLFDGHQLVSVSNGNCDVSQLCISHYFTKNYSPINGFRAKPHPEMLLRVCNDFQLTTDRVLHVGDSVEKDGGAAYNAGIDFFHFEPFVKPDSVRKSCQSLLQYIYQ